MWWQKILATIVLLLLTYPVIAKIHDLEKRAQDQDGLFLTIESESGRLQVVQKAYLDLKAAHRWLWLFVIELAVLSTIYIHFAQRFPKIF